MVSSKGTWTKNNVPGLTRLIILSRNAFGFWDLSLNLNIAGEPTATLALVSVARTFAAYLGLLLVPWKLSAFYLFGPVSFMSPWAIFLSLFSVLGLLAYAVFYAKKEPLVSFLIGWFFISSFMVSNLIPIGGLFAERFMYFPSAAYCFLFAFLFFRLFDQCRGALARNKKFLLQMVLIVTVVLYAQSSAVRNYVWRNDVTLWADTVKKAPQSMIARLFLADAYHARALYDKAMAEYAIVLEHPSAPKARIHNILGKIYGGRKQYDLAINEFLRSAKINPFDVETYYNLGITYFFTGDNARARDHFVQAQKIDKEYFWVYYGMGLVYEKEQKYKEAREMFNKALALSADFPKAQEALARLP